MADEKFDEWAVIELFGHQQIAGHVTERAVGGETFIRVDVPHPDGDYTRLFGKGAIYAMNPCAEELARKLAARTPSPLAVYTPRPPAAAVAVIVHADDDDDLDSDHDRPPY